MEKETDKIRMRTGKDKKFDNNRIFKPFILALAFLLIFILPSLSAQGSYVRSVPAYSYGGQTSTLLGTQIYPTFDTSACYGRQDFILQVDPTGCTPAVVRSDLLEEQPVSVLCPIVATQLNPLFQINDIKTINIVPSSLPRDVQTIGYQPAQAALGGQLDVGSSSFLGNIGYAQIVLRQQPNESAMPDFVQGNLTAKMTYDIQNAFGVGNALYYLPVLTDDEFNQNINAYSFWNGKGFLKMDGAENGQATISVYSGVSNAASSSTTKTKVASFTLSPGQTSSEIYLPGFSFCSGGLNVKLQGLEDPDTRAKLVVDSDIVEVKQGDSFLDGKCKVKSITHYGVNQNVQIGCNEDEKSSSFSLGINPKVTMTIGDTTRDYSVGDYLFDYQYGAKTDAVYLAFIGNSGKINTEKDIYIRTLMISKTTTSTQTELTNDQLGYVAGYDRAVSGSGQTGLLGVASDVGSFALASMIQAGKAFFTGKKLSYWTVDAGNGDGQLLGHSVKILGYSGVFDTDLSNLPSDTLVNYQNAMADYNTIIQSYAGETYPSGASVTKGQEALTGAIDLAFHFGQKKTAQQLCQQFSEYYSNVTLPEKCTDKSMLSSTSVSEQSVLINGQTHVIAFEGAVQPSFDEYGVQLTVRYPNNNITTVTLPKDGIFYVNESTGEYIRLSDLTADSATFSTNLAPAGTFLQKVITFVTNLRTHTLKINTEDNFGSSYTFSIQKINLQQVAKVSVIPDINYAQSNATFNFKIGIEKRAIQLTPQQTQDRIKSVNSTLKTLSGIQSTLDSVVKAGKVACLVTQGALMLKNFVFGSQSAARQQAMRNPGGWYDQCQNAVTKKAMLNGKGPFSNVDDCLQQNSAAVDATVNALDSQINSYNDNIQQISKGLPTTNFQGEKVPDTNALTSTLLSDPSFKSTLTSRLSGVYDGNQIQVGTKKVAINDIINGISKDTATLTQIENLQLYSGLLNSNDPTVSAIAKAQVQQTLGQISPNIDLATQRATAAASSPIPVYHGTGEKLTTVRITSVNTYSQLGTQFTGADILPGTNVIRYADEVSGRQYLLTLDNNLVITQTYSIGSDGKTLTVADQNNINPLKLSIQLAGSYDNQYLNPEVQYYETGQYAGLPAIVPFDLTHGWYAEIKSNLPVLGGLTSYESSGRISSFYVCNVGPNGKEENMAPDDVCEQFIPGSSQQPALFQDTLSATQSQALASQATQAINDATRQHTAGVQYVTINHQKIKVGQPAANTPNVQCEDFMSPSDCNILFNVCDPVICPSSRCNLGGAYPVQDVIQSGVVGSIALCLPNFPQVKVPICVSGLDAGVQGYMSVLQSYQQCLQTSLNTGQTVGICDEVNSVYTCQFFWSQVLPVIKYGLPKLLGQGSSGGGEYLAGSDAVTNAQKSLDYFTQYYASNSYKAFQARSTQDALTSETCKLYSSLVVPSGDLLDTLVAPDSPPQYYAQFDEIPYTTATNPPTSQYNVYYHIYAGTDAPSYYRVYFKGSSSSFYQDTATNRLIASGYIPVGGSTDNTTSFTGPSGYQQLCITVNGQEKCGFQKVTTNFAINSITDQYLAQQAAQTDITTEAACNSGTPSAYSLLNPNVQAGATAALNPAIYNQGIIRICSTSNPGQSTDPGLNTASQRWQSVGYCDSQNIKCWLDTQSVKNVIQNQNVEDSTLQTVSTQFVNALQSSGSILDQTGFSSLISQLDSMSGQDLQIIAAVTGNLSHVSRNNQKAELYSRRAAAYADLAGYGIDQALANELASCMSCLQSGNEYCMPEESTYGGSCVPAGVCTVVSVAGSSGISASDAQFSCSTLINTNKAPPSTQQEAVNPNGADNGAQCTANSDCNSNYCDTSNNVCANSPTTENGNNPPSGTDTGAQPIIGTLDNLGVNYPIFTFSNAEYTYSNTLSSWFWCTSGCSDINNWYPENGLAGQDYSGGLQYLMQKTVQNNQGGFLHTISFGLLGNAKLSTEDVDFTPDGILTIRNNIPNDQLIPNAPSSNLRYPIYFMYNLTDQNWEWSSDKKNWIPAPRINDPTNQKDIITQKLSLLVEGLNKLNYGDGAELIFSIDTQNPLNLPTEMQSGTATGTGSAITCTDKASCQIALGNEILKQADLVVRDRNLAGTTLAAIQTQTGAKSFGCLALQQAMIESQISQCGQLQSGQVINFQQNGDPLYCEGDTSKVLISGTPGEASTGIMQINTAAHTDISPTELTYLGDNINYGLNYLVSNLNLPSRVYKCNEKTYSGWTAALRAYNGWASPDSKIDCTKGDTNYVEKIIAPSNKAAVAALFPQCA